MLNDIPVLGVGLSFRTELKAGILASPHRVDFLELIADQYIDKPLFKDQEARELSAQFPVVLHGVDLSIGTDCPVDEEYVNKLRVMADAIRPRWISDHLCFTRIPGNSLGQLTPLSFNEEVVEFVVQHIKQVNKRLNCPFLIENISYYFTAPPTTMTEAEFISNIAEQSDCGLLLDLTNLLNNSINHGYDPIEFLNQIPLDRVVQIHLAGGTYAGKLLLDTHNRPVPSDVLDMLAYAAPKMTRLRGVNIERDGDFPPIEELFAELDYVRTILAANGQAQLASNPLNQ